jgi:hypothetical protein
MLSRSLTATLLLVAGAACAPTSPPSDLGSLFGPCRGGPPGFCRGPVADRGHPQPSRSPARLALPDYHGLPPSAYSSAPSSEGEKV